MGTYIQWQNRVNKSIKRVTWICGVEKVLIELAIDEIRESLKPNEFISLNSTDGESIWDNANQYPLALGDIRLILVRDADEITDWRKLESWLDNTRTLPNVYLIFVSNQDGLYGQKDRFGNKPWLPPLCLRNPAKVSAIDCKRPNKVELIEFVLNRTKADRVVAERLVKRVGGNLYSITNLCTKVALFGGYLNEAIIDTLCDEVSEDSFVMLLLALEKSKALKALDCVSVDDYDDIIVTLDTSIDLLGKLNPLLGRNLSMKEVSLRVEASETVVRKLFPLAKHYPLSKLRHCSQVLVLIDELYNNGARDDLLELLVSTW